MLRYLAIVACVAACKYPALPELGGNGTDGGPNDGNTTNSDGKGIDASTMGPPTGLSYTSSFALYTEDIAIAPNMPSAAGAPITAYAVSPALPTGLSLDTTTGVISGTPTVEANIASYNVTASNSAGATTATLSLGVNSYVLAAGQTFTCVRVTTGVKCWGDNESGQLGNSSFGNSATPVAVVNLTTGVEAVVAGGLTACALVNGGVQCWGDDSAGEIGDGGNVNVSMPTAVHNLTSGVQAIAAGNTHECAILTTGGVECWGFNSNGQLGNNSTDDSGFPVQVTGLTSGATSIAAGGNTTCAVVNGGAKCWGYNASGELGNNTTADSTVPVAVLGLSTGVQSIVVGTNHACALLVNGSVECWGDNSSGELGNNSTAESNVPVAVTGLATRVQLIAAGDNETCALLSGGMECWGANPDGELGTGTTAQSNVPVGVSGLSSGVQTISVALGLQACAVASNGVKCWGDNNDGQLGTGGGNSLVPVNVSGLSTGVQP